MNNLTVKQVAEELHISERAVQKKFERYGNELKQYLKRENNRYFFDVEGIETLRNIGVLKKKAIKQQNDEPNYTLRSLEESYINQINELKKDKEELKIEKKELKDKILLLETEIKSLREQEKLPLLKRLFFKK